MQSFSTTAEYIALQEEPFRSKLEELKTIILSVVPQATDAISYQIPCFTYFNHLVGIGVTKKHVSLYLMSTTIIDDLGIDPGEVNFMGTKSTIHFPPDKPLPKALIKKLVKARAKFNEERAVKKNGS